MTKTTPHPRDGSALDERKNEKQERNKKANAATQETIAFLDELSTREDVWPAIRRKARRLLGLWALVERGPGPRLKLGDPGRVVSFIDRKIGNGKSRQEAIALAAERFSVTERRIEQVYKEFLERPI